RANLHSPPRQPPPCLPLRSRRWLNPCRLGRGASASTTGAAVAGNAKNYGSPAKTRTASASRAKETVADTARRAKDRFGGMYAANCGKLVSTRTDWVNKGQETDATTAKPAEVACNTNWLSPHARTPAQKCAGVAFI